MFLWAQTREGRAGCACRIHHWRSGMFILIREHQASCFSKAVSVPGLSWIQLWLVAFVAGSGATACPAFSSAPQSPWCEQRASPVWCGAVLTPCLHSPTSSQLSWSPPAPRELAKNICLPYPVFSRCSFRWCRDRCKDQTEESLGEFAPLLPPPTAHNSCSVCTALPLCAAHSDAL